MARNPGRAAAAAAPRARRAQSHASRPSSYRTGQATRAAIIRAAESALLEYGHARFTVQRVAQKLGISPGNVNYYFPTKASLLEALILYTLLQYRRRVRLADDKREGGKAATPAEVLGWLMDDAISQHTNRLFRELWAIALNDPRVARAVDDFYTRSVHGHLRRLTQRWAFRKDASQLEAVVFLMHVISEGTTVLFGMRAGSKELYTRLRATAIEAIAPLLTPAASARGNTSP